MLRYIVDRLLLWGIGSVVAIAILGVGALWLINRDHEHPRTVRDDLRRLYDGARAYYMDEDHGARGSSRLAQPSTGFVPPLGECCRQGGKCEPDPAWWAGEPWSALYFSMESPHRHSFAYRVAADGRSFTVAASGDIDCDGEYSTFEAVGIVGSDGEVPAMGAVYRDQEVE